MTKAIHIILFLTLFSVFTFAQKSIGLIGGSIFDGQKFVKKDLFVVGGKITFKKPEVLEMTIDIKNRFVTPPFGDAHMHSLSNARTFESQIEKNIEAGNFYVQVLANSQKAVASFKQKVEDSPLDVLYANGGLTSTLGHPFFAFEPQALGITGRYWEDPEALRKTRKSRLAENDGYWFFDSTKDVDDKWEKYLAGKPDVVKIFLLDAENQKNLSVEEKSGLKGLLPEVAEYIVKKAHQSKLRVFAHVETANDLRLGIKIGVDGFAHLPGYGSDWKDSAEAAAKYDPTREDFKKIAEKKIIVIPTLALSKDYSYRWKSDGTFELNKERADKMAARQTKLLNIMLDEKVRIALGSDSSDETITKEIFYINEYKLLEPLKLLQIAFETPHLMFPKRKIGKIEDGFEASFLILKANPLTNLETIKNIEMRFKQGQTLSIKENNL